jgi:hypothetical protein
MSPMSLFNKAFTKEEFFFFWLPTMIVAAGILAVLVMQGLFDGNTAVMYEMIVGVLAYAVAKRVNITKLFGAKESEGESSGQ